MADADRSPTDRTAALADIEDARREITILRERIAAGDPDPGQLRREIDDLDGQIAAAEEWLFVERVYGGVEV